MIFQKLSIIIDWIYPSFQNFVLNLHFVKKNDISLIFFQAQNLLDNKSIIFT